MSRTVRSARYQQIYYTLRGKTHGVSTIGNKVPYVGRPPNGQWT